MEQKRLMLILVVIVIILAIAGWFLMDSGVMLSPGPSQGEIIHPCSIGCDGNGKWDACYVTNYPGLSLCANCIGIVWIPNPDQSQGGYVKRPAQQGVHHCNEVVCECNSGRDYLRDY